MYACSTAKSYFTGKNKKSLGYDFDCFKFQNLLQLFVMCNSYMYIDTA